MSIFEYFLLIPIDVPSFKFIEGQIKELQGVVPNTPPRAENDQKSPGSLGLKLNSVIIIDNASYHSRNAKDFPLSKWRKAQFQSWLTENKISFKQDALRSELWTLCKKYRTDKASKGIDNIAKRYGHEVIPLPPYHCDLNAIELIWADEKN